MLVLAGFIAWGISTSPFGWDLGILPSDPVPVDAIPDIGENQQIVFTEWKGRSPQDIEDQISYPLTTYLLGIPGVKSIRSTSVFGFSSIFIIFACRQAFCLKGCNLPSDRMPLPWGRSSGIPWKAATKKEILPEAGTCMRSGPSRIFM